MEMLAQFCLAWLSEWDATARGAKHQANAYKMCLAADSFLGNCTCSPMKEVAHASAKDTHSKSA